MWEMTCHGWGDKSSFSYDIGWVFAIFYKENPNEKNYVNWLLQISTK
jgi:hypothetical protein